MLSVLACGAVGMETLPYFLVLKGSCADVVQWEERPLVL